MRVSVLGVTIDSLTMAEVVAKAEAFIGAGRPRLIATANAEMVMVAQEDRQLADILARADLVVADGAGVVWAARRLGQPVPERVAGYDLAQALLARAAERGWRVFLFGGAPGIAEAAAAVAVDRYPGLTIAGLRNGFFTAADEDDIVAAIKAGRPHILFAALGVPKQENWLDRHLAELAVPVAMGVGGTFDVMAGVAKRAPLWMQQAGLEWLYRLAREPRRLMRMLALPRFVLRVLAAKKH